MRKYIYCIFDLSGPLVLIQLESEEELERLLPDIKAGLGPLDSSTAKVGFWLEEGEDPQTVAEESVRRVLLGLSASPN